MYLTVGLIHGPGHESSVGEWMYLTVCPIHCSLARVQFPVAAKYFKGVFTDWSHADATRKSPNDAPRETLSQRLSWPICAPWMTLNTYWFSKQMTWCWSNFCHIIVTVLQFQLYSRPTTKNFAFQPGMFFDIPYHNYCRGGADVVSVLKAMKTYVIQVRSRQLKIPEGLRNSHQQRYGGQDCSFGKKNLRSI